MEVHMIHTSSARAVDDPHPTSPVFSGSGAKRWHVPARHEGEQGEIVIIMYLDMKNANDWTDNKTRDYTEQKCHT